MEQDGRPDVNSPEFRSAILANFMDLQESVLATLTFVNYMDTVNFKDLTPAQWATIQSYMPHIKRCAEYNRQALQQVGAFMDAPGVMEMVRDVLNTPPK